MGIASQIVRAKQKKMFPIDVIYSYILLVKTQLHYHHIKLYSVDFNSIDYQDTFGIIDFGGKNDF